MADIPLPCKLSRRYIYILNLINLKLYCIQVALRNFLYKIEKKSYATLDDLKSASKTKTEIPQVQKDSWLSRAICTPDSWMAICMLLGVHEVPSAPFLCRDGTIRFFALEIQAESKNGLQSFFFCCHLWLWALSAKSFCPSSSSSLWAL